MHGPLRRAVLVLLCLAALLAAGTIAVAAGAYREASQKPVPISDSQATAKAMKALPNNGAGFTVVALQLEPSSKHFDFMGANGQGFGEDQVQECLAIPPLGPLPFISPCRYYPVWVVVVTKQGCAAAIAINAFTGRFGGAGGGDCALAIIPGGGAESQTRWFQPEWG